MTVAKLENMCMISSLKMVKGMKSGASCTVWLQLQLEKTTVFFRFSVLTTSYCSLAVVTIGENNSVLQIQCSDHKLLYSLAVQLQLEKTTVFFRFSVLTTSYCMYSLAVVTVREFAFTSDCLFPTPDHQLHTTPHNARQC